MVRLALPGMIMHITEFATEKALTLAAAWFGHITAGRPKRFSTSGINNLHRPSRCLDGRINPGCDLDRRRNHQRSKAFSPGGVFLPIITLYSKDFPKLTNPSTGYCTRTNPLVDQHRPPRFAPISSSVFLHPGIGSHRHPRQSYSYDHYYADF